MRELYTGFTMLISGYFIQKSTYFFIKGIHNFVYVFLALAGINLIVHTARRIAEKKEAEIRDEIEAGSMSDE